jgi:hypothetical protein
VVKVYKVLKNLIRKVLKASDELLLPDIVSLCGCFLARFINTKNAIEFLEIGHRYHAVGLKESCLDFGISRLTSLPKY